MIFAFFLEKKHLFPTLLKILEVGDLLYYRYDSTIKMKTKTLGREIQLCFFN